MKWAIALTLLYANLAKAEPSSCGTEASSSESSNDSSSSWSSDSESTDTEEACVDATALVGETTCSSGEFGRGWNVSGRRPVVLSLETGVRGLRLGDLRFRTSHHDNQYRVDVASFDRRRQFYLQPRLTFFPARYFYVGVQGSLGATRGDEFRSGDLQVRVNRIVVVGAEAIAGVALPVRNLQLFAELAGGIRASLLDLETEHADCIEELSRALADWTLTARIGVDVFRSPALSVGVHAGYDPLRQEVLAGLRLSVHSRAYNAQ
ncbi:MAG: hypothetical protein AAGE52_09925 [Myxococcota bacterium]